MSGRASSLLKRFRSLSYCRHIGVKLPVPTPTSIGSNTTPLTIDALSTLARAKEEDSVSGAFGPKRNVASTLGADAALEAKLGHLEPNDAVVEGAATETTESVVDVGEDYGLHAPPEPSKPFDLWNLIMGKQYALANLGMLS